MCNCCAFLAPKTPPRAMAARPRDTRADNWMDDTEYGERGGVARPTATGGVYPPRRRSGALFDRSALAMSSTDRMERKSRLTLPSAIPDARLGLRCMSVAASPCNPLICEGESLVAEAAEARGSASDESVSIRLETKCGEMLLLEL